MAQVFLDFTIHLTDAARVVELQGTSFGSTIGVPWDPGFVILAPSVAEVTYAAPRLQPTPPVPFVAPSITSPHFANPNFPQTERTFERRMSGVFGWVIGLFGLGKTRYYWKGTFLLAASNVVGEPGIAGEVPTAIATRRFLDGFETDTIRSARGASRHLQGFGAKFDNTVNTITHGVSEATAGVPSNKPDGWDRIYLRPRKFPTAASAIWETTGFPTAGNGVGLQMLPTGALAAINISATVRSVIGTSPPIPVDAWKKLDILWHYGADAYFKVYLNGAILFDLATAVLPGLVGGTGGQNTLIGGGPANGFVWDADDWVGADLPAGGSAAGILPGLDWNSGSKIAWVSSRDFAADHNPLWVGEWHTLRQRPQGNTAVPTLLTSTASARLSVTTDADLEIDGAGIGVAAMVVHLYSFRGTLSGTLGYKLPGGAAVMAAIVQGAVVGYNKAWYLPAGVLNPLTPLAGLELLHDKGADAVASQAFQLSASVEVLGLFGQEDVVPGAGPAAADPAVIEPSQTAAYVSAIKAQVVAAGISITGACGAFEITKRVAWGLRAQGAGLRLKTGGNNCNGYGVDVLCFSNGQIVDILIDGGGANTPSWSVGIIEPTWYGPALDPGDMPAALTVPPALGIHNAPYPRSMWATGGSPPMSPVVIHGGTYVGTGTTLELLFRCPIHWLWIRQTVSHANLTWWSSVNGGHKNGAEMFMPSAPVEVLIDPNFVAGSGEDDQKEQTVVRLNGATSGNSFNEAGVTYNFLAFSDPAMRFLDCGALVNYAGAADLVSSLDREDFTPDAVWAQQEPNSGAVATMRQFYKGPGHAVGAISPTAAAEIASGLAMGLGTLTYKSGLALAAMAQIAYAAFRTDDGSGDVGVPEVVSIGTYVGDGSASRTIGLSPASGKRPMWAIVVGHNGSSLLRDASHAGTISTTTAGAANAATGITAGGIDAITVGALLNVNAVVYDVFVFPSCDDTAGNNGWGLNCEHSPVSPTVPIGAPWIDGPADPEGLPVEAAVSVEPGGDDTDFGAQCIAASTKVINIALSRIGVSKRVGNISTEQSTEAAVGRLHYSEDLSATLRDFPWPFATRYVDLVLVAGTSTVPVNGDWLYSYRAPVNMMKARRIVNPNLVGRAFDPTPSQFRVGSDATPAWLAATAYAVGDRVEDLGLVYVAVLAHVNAPPPNALYWTVSTAGLIYTDEEDPELEYTIRPECAAASGDPIFRSALAWRHAASLAPVLSKDAKKATFCLQMYKLLLNEAATVGSQEQQQAKDGDADWIRGRE